MSDSFAVKVRQGVKIRPGIDNYLFPYQIKGISFFDVAVYSL